MENLTQWGIFAKQFEIKNINSSKKAIKNF